jgi:hypothetical protein
MRQGLQAKFEREVDPEGKLSPQERAKRAEYARKAHMERLALKSAKRGDAGKSNGYRASSIPRRHSS